MDNKIKRELRSLSPFPYISVVPSPGFISSGLNVHNSDIRIPLENRSSMTAASRKAFFSDGPCQPF